MSVHDWAAPNPYSVIIHYWGWALPNKYADLYYFLYQQGWAMPNKYN
jgi:hypothetical protein